MHQNKFFTLEIGDAEGRTVTLKPSNYIETLHPHQAIEELKEYIQTLEQALDRYACAGSGIDEQVGNIGHLAFELELARSLVRFFKDAYSTVH